MAWIESHQSLGHHRKTLQVAATLKVDRHKLIGHLQVLWWWGLDNADSTGKLGHVSTRAIAEAAEWPARDSDRFVHALTSAGFLEHDQEGFSLHDWYDYAGKLTDARVLRRESNRIAQSARRQRLRQRTVSADSSASQQSTVPNPTGPDRTGPAPPRVPPQDVSADALLTNGDAPKTCCALAELSHGERHAASCRNLKIS